MPRPARSCARAFASPINTQPANATAQPAKSRRGKPSCRKIPARIAIRIGPTLISIAAERRVDAEEEHAEGGDAQQVAPLGQRLAPDRGRGSEHDQADEQ